MNAFEFNKVAGAVLGSALILLALSRIGDVLYPMPGAERHGEDAERVLHYAVEVAETSTGGATEAAAEEPLGVRLAAGDAAKGEKVAKKCAACHTFEADGANKVGPNLHNIVGANRAHAADFAYSAAITGLGGAWTYEELDAFLANPKQYAKGTKMTFAGVKDPQDRADLLLYLVSVTEAPPPLPTP
ncbi:MAG: cytochrome c family protein [Alphaproteobacteria bacterium]